MSLNEQWFVIDLDGSKVEGRIDSEVFHKHGNGDIIMNLFASPSKITWLIIFCHSTC